MSSNKFLFGEIVYVAGRKGKDVAEYVFLEYSKEYPDYAMVMFMANDKEHTMLIRIAALYKTYSAAKSVKRAVPQRKRRGAVPHPYWLLPKTNYKAHDIQ